MNFSQFMELKFIEWQHQVGGRKTVLTKIPSSHQREYPQRNFATSATFRHPARILHRSGSYPGQRRPPHNNRIYNHNKRARVSNHVEDLIFPQLTDDEGFWLKLVETYQTPVYNLCYRMLGEPDLAEDAAQETLISPGIDANNPSSRNER